MSAAISPVILGTAYAFSVGRANAIAAIFALAAAICIQIGTNFANDVFDHENGADTPERLGPKRMTATGAISARAMKVGMGVAFGLAMACGTVLIVRGGWVILAIGLASIAAGILYTGGPFPLGYLGLGDLMVLVFFGPVAVVGTYYVQALSVDWRVGVFGLSAGLFSTAILAVNNLRDRVEDASTGKRTLAVRFGPSFARIEYTFCVLVAIWLPVGFLHHGRIQMAIVSGVVTLVSVASLIAVWTREGRDLNRCLGKTGMLLVTYTVGMSAVLVALAN